MSRYPDNPSIPGVFTTPGVNGPRRYAVESWHSLVTEDLSPQVKDRLHVTRVIHVKNLSDVGELSGVKHEYLHIIVRDGDGRGGPGTGCLTRLVAERDWDQIADRVVVGLWRRWLPRQKPTGAEDPEAGGRVPMPLVTLKFDHLPLEQLSLALMTVSKSRPKYNLFWYNCYWYANSVINLLKQAKWCTGGFEWDWANWQGVAFSLTSWPSVCAIVLYPSVVDHRL